MTGIIKRQLEILECLRYEHHCLEEQEISKPFYNLAVKIAQIYPASDDTHKAMLKLLQSQISAIKAL